MHEIEIFVSGKIHIFENFELKIKVIPVFFLPDTGADLLYTRPSYSLALNNEVHDQDDGQIYIS